MKKIISSTSKIRFQDCDPFNHLNNSKYIDYLINAREDQLIANYDLDIYKQGMLTGKSWVVASNQIAYLKPAFTMETVYIDSQVLKYNEKSLFVELRMWNENQKHLKAVMWSKFTHFDIKAQKSALHSEEYMTLFENVVSPIQEKTFEERILQLLKK